MSRNLAISSFNGPDTDGSHPGLGEYDALVVLNKLDHAALRQHIDMLDIACILNYAKAEANPTVSFKILRIQEGDVDICFFGDIDVARICARVELKDEVLYAILDGLSRFAGAFGVDAYRSELERFGLKDFVPKVFDMNKPGWIALKLVKHWNLKARTLPSTRG